MENHTLMESWLLFRNEAAIDVIGLPGDIPRSRRSQKNGHSGHVFGIVRTSDRDRLHAAAVHLLRRDALLARAIRQHCCREHGACYPRTDRVDVDVMGPELLRSGAR